MFMHSNHLKIMNSEVGVTQDSRCHFGSSHAPEIRSCSLFASENPPARPNWSVLVFRECTDGLIYGARFINMNATINPWPMRLHDSRASHDIADKRNIRARVSTHSEHGRVGGLD